jgi:hypothetical protein
MAVYDITIEVTDPDVSPKTLRWLLSEAGEVIEITKWDKGDQPDSPTGDD